MAKALFGHVGGPDLQVAAEIARLRGGSATWRTRSSALQAANDALTSRSPQTDLAGLDRVELPADVAVATGATLTARLTLPYG